MDSRRSFPLEPKLMSSVIAEYKGEYHESCYHGQGYAKFHDGHEYTGTFEGGRLHGNGCFTWADETKYTGEFRNNSVTGTGKYEWTDGSVYEGEVYGGLRHGEGSFQSGTCNARYDGSWERGKRHGNGKLTYDIGRSSYYEGEWFNGCRHGQGKMFYPSGNTYQGEWKNDMKHGHGAMYWLDLNEYYIGSWMNDLQDGQGEHTWKEEPPEMMARIQKQMCNRYIGGFKEGMRHGKGIFYYANGAKYQGEWEKNQKHGRGLFIFEDGSIYSGPFDRDRMVERKIDRAADVVKPKLVLNIYDILPSGKKYDSAKREIDNTILRINTDLKTIYKYYSVGSAASDSTEGSFAMDMRSMRRFVQDCNLKKNSITTAEIDRLFQKVKEMQRREIDKIGIPYEDPTQEVMDIHDSALPILYREFVELVVRIAYAHSIYREGQGHLAHALIELYINNIRDSACKVRGNYCVYLRSERQRFRKPRMIFNVLFIQLQSHQFYSNTEIR